MPFLLGVLGELNVRFSEHRVHELVAQRANFAQDKPFASVMADLVGSPGNPGHEALKAFIAAMPGSFQKALAAGVHSALSTTPPTLVNWSWAPGYDYELTINHVPETAPEPSGLMVRLKSRYPEDPHPMTPGG
jgi:hypothetical protein